MNLYRVEHLTPSEGYRKRIGAGRGYGREMHFIDCPDLPYHKINYQFFFTKPGFRIFLKNAKKRRKEIGSKFFITKINLDLHQPHIAYEDEYQVAIIQGWKRDNRSFFDILGPSLSELIPIDF